jgi:hypothetical protein
MNEQELRSIVREAIAAVHVKGLSAPVPPSVSVIRQHASHALFTVPAGADADGPCIIEPAVACNHCGYCKSYGH